jgi:hypothetical protein
MDRHHQHLSSPKRIYVYPLHRDFRAILRGESGSEDNLKRHEQRCRLA